MDSIELHPYQDRGKICILENPKCGLFYPMGAGKTLTVLSALDELVNERFEVNKILIIGPLRVITSTWPDEIKKWGFNLSYSVVAGSRSQREKALARKADIYLIGKENVVWLTEYLKSRWDFDMVVIDELSAFKNPQAKRFRALRRMPYERFVGLTGTPTPKGIPDLWSQIYLMDKGERLMKTLGGFRNRWLYPVSSNGYVVYKYGLKPGAEEEIKDRISDICMSISQSEYSTLPDLSEIDSEIEFSDEEMKRYRQFRRDQVLTLAEGEISAANAGVLSGKLNEFTSGQVYDDEHKPVTFHDRKLERLMRLLEEADGEPVIIFHYYKHERARIIEALKKEKYKFSTLENPEDIADWNAGKFDALLIQPGSAGHGLNLQQGGHIAIWYSLPNWNCEYYDQANARIYRQGQKEKVTIYHLIVKGTIDEAQLAALRNRKEFQKKLLEALRR